MVVYKRAWSGLIYNIKQTLFSNRITNKPPQNILIIKQVYSNHTSYLITHPLLRIPKDEPKRKLYDTFVDSAGLGTDLSPSTYW